MLGAVEVETAESVDLRRTERPVELEFEKSAGDRADGFLAEPLRRRNFTEEIREVAKVLLDQVDVGDAKAIEVPILHHMDQRKFFHAAEKGIARAEVTGTKFPAIEGDLAEVLPVVLRGVEKASDLLFIAIQETDVFAAKNDLIASGLILRGTDHTGKSGKIRRIPNIIAEPFGASAQARRQRLSRTVRIVVDAAASPAGLAAVGLTEVGERFVRHSPRKSGVCRTAAVERMIPCNQRWRI